VCGCVSILGNVFIFSLEIEKIAMRSYCPSGNNWDERLTHYLVCINFSMYKLDVKYILHSNAMFGS
jgi:hypothetical protein